MSGPPGLGTDPWPVARYAAALPAAAVVTLGLLWGMQYLVSTDTPVVGEALPGAVLDFVRIERTPPPPPRRRERPRRPPPAQTPPPEPPPPALQPAAATPGTIVVGIPEVQTGIRLGHAGFSIGTGDGDYLPIFKVAPNYPQRALQRGIEGYCTVQYTVTVQGSVRDARVLEEHCTHTLFREPSLQAALKFKYKPRIIDGLAVQVTGVRNRFIYRIEDAP